jgi:transposase
MCPGKAIDYSLTRFLAEPALPIDNHHDEQQIHPWATGRKNCLLAAGPNWQAQE